MTWPSSILSVLVWTPALGALVSTRLGEERLRRRAAVGFAVVTFALAAALAITFDPAASPRELRRWMPALGLSYDLHLGGFSSLLIVWISLLALVALAASRARGRHSESLVLVSEASLLGLALAGDGALFLSFYGAALLSVTLLLGRADTAKTFLVVQTAGAAIAMVSFGISYHLSRIQTGFFSGEMSRFSSLVTFPDFEPRMFLLGAAAVAFAAPLFPLTPWVKARELPMEGTLLLFGGWSLAGTLFFARATLPAYSGGRGLWFATALAAGSLLYAGISSRRSWAPLLVGFQGLVVLGLLSPDTDGVAAGRAAMLQLPIALAVLALWTADSEDRGSPFTSALALAMFLPVSWLVLRARWTDAPVLASLSGMGVLLTSFHAARSLPPLSFRRVLRLLPLLALWAIALVAPSRFLPEDSSPPSAGEE